MEFVVGPESVDTPGVRALVNAAQDELDRRYGLDDTDTGDLRTNDMVPPSGTFIVARLDGHLAGGVALRSIGRPERHFGEIKRLWVRPDLRGSGVASLLMARVEDDARSFGMAQLLLETGWKQPEAIKFYERTGWTRLEDFPDNLSHFPLSYKFAKIL